MNSSHAEHEHADMVEEGDVHNHRAGHYHMYLDSEEDAAEDEGILRSVEEEIEEKKSE